MGHNYHHVRAAVRGGRKKIPSPKEDSVTDLGLTNWQKKVAPQTPLRPGLGFTTLGQKKVAPQTPLRPGLGFTTLGQTAYYCRSTEGFKLYRVRIYIE
jgi:hypothetical protein